MAQYQGNYNTVKTIGDSRLVRLVREDGLLLEPEVGPLITFLAQIEGKMKPEQAIRVEWFEDDYIARVAQNSNATVTNSTANNVITVASGDAAKFVVGDVVMIPQATTVGGVPELVRVTARNLSTDELTVTRAFAGTTIATIPASTALYILAPAYAEGSALPENKQTRPVGYTTYPQIFKKTFKISKSMAALAPYASGGNERKREHEKLLKQMKIDMNRAFLWSKASEDLTATDVDGNTTRLATTMGLNSRITTNRTNAGGNVTYDTFEAFARQAFRYSDGQLVLLSSGILLSAINTWGERRIQVSPEETVYGVKIRRLVTSHGEFILVRDRLLDEGISGQTNMGHFAFALNLEELSMFYLKGNNEDRNVHLVENKVMDGRDAYIDEALGEIGLVVRHEKKHAVMYNITGYEA